LRGSYGGFTRGLRGFHEDPTGFSRVCFCANQAHEQPAFTTTNVSDSAATSTAAVPASLRDDPDSQQTEPVDVIDSAKSTHTAAKFCSDKNAAAALFEELTDDINDDETIAGVTVLVHTYKYAETDLH
jgi:hypothetical protein